jgi:hypothetical protein
LPTVLDVRRRPRLSSHLGEKIGAALRAVVLVLVAAAVPAGTSVASATSRSGALPAASLVYTSARLDSIIQWVVAAGHVTGTYDGVAVELSGQTYSSEQAHCAITGIDSGSSIAFTLSSCTNAATDGNYFSRVDASGLLLEVASGNGTLTGLQFVPGAFPVYDAAVLSLHRFVAQENALTTYLSDSQRTATPYFRAVASPFFQVATGWFDVVGVQVNAAGDHAQAVADLEVLDWRNSAWLEAASFPLSSATGPVPATPFVLHLPGAIAYAVPLSWQLYRSYEVVAYTRGAWRLVPFATDTRLSPHFAVEEDQMSGTGPTITRTMTGCLTHGRDCSTVTIVYTYEPTSSDAAINDGPAFVITASNGPATDFEAS